MQIPLKPKGGFNHAVLGSPRRSLVVRRQKNAYSRLESWLANLEWEGSECGSQRLQKSGFLEGLGTTNAGAFLSLFPGTMRYVIA
jgi:hypothetical protein